MLFMQLDVCDKLDHVCLHGKWHARFSRAVFMCPNASATLNPA
jgi:hypothetical protein